MLFKSLLQPCAKRNFPSITTRTTRTTPWTTRTTPRTTRTTRRVVLVIPAVVLVVLGVVLVVLEANIEQNIEHRTLFSEQ